MKRNALCLFLVLLGTGFSPAAADDPPAKDETKYASMPWHLVDTWWNIGQESPFESLAVDVTIGEDVPASVNLYISPIGLGHLSKSPFYGGLQTQSDGYTKSDPNLRGIGRGFLFSMWNERSPDAIRPSVGGFFQSSGHEGDFVSVRRPYEWKKGKHTYRLTRMDQQMIDGKPFTWVGAFVYSHAKDENVFVGALRFKGEKLVLDSKVANFIEIYGRRKPVSEIPQVTVTFGPPVVNGTAAKNPKAEAVYPKGVPDYANAVAKEGALVITVGQHVEGREKRRITLIEGKK
jgi:hypothetical protein